MPDRRTFMKSAATTAIAAAATRLTPLMAESKKRSPNDTIQLALIGAGIQGQGDTHFALQVPGVKLVSSSRLLRRPPHPRKRDVGFRPFHDA